MENSGDPATALILDFVRGLQNPSELDGGPSAISFGTSLVQLGLIDSFNIIEIAAFLEKTFEIRIPSEDITISNFQSVRDIVSLVERLQKESRST